MPQPPSMFMRGPHDPLRIERAEGPWLYASDGRKILDAGGGAVVVNVGQGRREIAEVAARTIANLDYIVPVWSSRPARAAGRAALALDSGGADAVLFHQRRIGVGRSGAEVRDTLPPRSRANNRRTRSSGGASPITATPSQRCRRAGAGGARTTNTFYWTGRRSIRATATDARGARPIHHARSTARRRLKKRS